MKAPTLSKRLRLVADMVRVGVVAADIGTDHAYLPVFLTASGRVPRAYACDIKEKPLQKAAATISQYDMCDRVTTVLCDGLAALEPHSVQDIIIAGMGGDMIAHILADADWVKSGEINLILQPMTKQEELRRFLFENGYDIVKENGVCDGRHIYTVMLARYTGEVTHPGDLLLSLGRLPQSTLPDSKKYIDSYVKRLDKQRAGLLRSGSAASLERARQLKELTEKIAQITKE